MSLKTVESRNLGLAFSIHKQPFPLAYYCGNNSIKWHCFPKPVPLIELCSQLSLMCWADQWTIHYNWNLTIFELSAPFSDMLYSQYAITTPLSTGSVLKRRKRGLPTRTVSHFIHLHRPTFPTSSLHINLTHEQHSTDSCTAYWILLPLEVLPTMEIQNAWFTGVTVHWILSSCVTYCCVYSKSFQLMYTVW